MRNDACVNLVAWVYLATTMIEPIQFGRIKFVSQKCISRRQLVALSF
jgi:hypothetical protein